jgi:hypothetical protein
VAPLDTALPWALVPWEFETPLPSPAKAAGAPISRAPDAGAATASFFMSSPPFSEDRDGVGVSERRRDLTAENLA